MTPNRMFFQGITAVRDKVNMATEDSIKKSGTNAIFRIDDGSSMRGMRVDITFTFLAHGTYFPIRLTVSGLTKDKLPGTDFLVLEVPGLCIGSRGVSVGNK